MAVELVIARLSRPFDIRNKSQETSIRHHGKDSGKMVLREPCHIVSDRPRDSFRILDKLRSQFLCGPSRCPRFRTEVAIICTSIISINVSETLFVVGEACSSSRKDIAVGKAAAHCSNEPFENSLYHVSLA